MKKFFIVVIFIAVVAIIALGFIPSTHEYSSTVVEQVQDISEEVVKKDSVQEAQEFLDRANELLDVEEQKELEKIADAEKRLEEIRATRMSFTQAPEPVK